MMGPSPAAGRFSQCQKTRLTSDTVCGPRSSFSCDSDQGREVGRAGEGTDCPQTLHAAFHDPGSRLPGFTLRVR